MSQSRATRVPLMSSNTDDLETLQRTGEDGSVLVASARQYGLQPIVAFECSPIPGGLYGKMAMMFLGYVSTLVSLCNFAQHQSYVSAVLLAMISMNCVRLQFMFVQNAEELRFQAGNTLTTGFMQPLMKHFLAITISSKHCWTVFIVAYSSLFAEESKLACLLQLVTYAFSVYTIVCEDVDNHMGDELCQVGKFLVGGSECGWIKSCLLTWWSVCHVAGSIAMSALVMKVWHPLLALLLFFPCGWVNRDSPELPVWKQMFFIFTEPLESLLFTSSSVFGFPALCTIMMEFGDPPNFGNKPAWPLAMAHLFRLASSAALLQDYIHGCLAADLQEMFQRDMFETSMVVQVLIFVPLDVLAMACQILRNPSWRDGIQHEAATATMVEIAKALIIFAD